MRVYRTDLVERRAKVLAVLIWLCFVVLLGRLWILQIIKGAYNLRVSVEYATRDILIPAPRGVFYDRHGRLLVANRSGYDVVGLVDQLKKQPEVLARLARLLECTPEEILNRLTTPNITPYQLYPIAKNIPMPTALHIQESLDLPGIEVLEVPLREYKYGDFATHSFGYVREISNEELTRLASSGYQMGDMIGKTGLERTIEPYLRGQDGVRVIEVDRNQRPTRELYARAPNPGSDAWLTLDFEVQKAAEDALRSRLSHLRSNTAYRHARAGAVIALDPRNGEILALASQPSFDPNLFVNVVSAKEFAALNADPDKPFNNRVLRGLYPPASTFKPFTVFAALQDGKAKPNETFFCSGYDRIYKSLAKCWIAAQGRGHGVLTLVGGLKNSCNVVMYELGRRLGVEKLAYYTRMFHFGRSTGLDLAPGDTAGTVPDLAYKKRLRPDDPWRELETLHFAIGQGYLEVTPIQLALAYAGLANGGVFPRPHLVREIRRVDGTVLRRFGERGVLDRVKMDEATRRVILEGLNEVVSGGTASGAFAGFPLDRYPIAGKTGTGQKKGYDDFSLFACFAPADKPRIVVVVVLEQGGAGSTGAAPVARKILEAFFHVRPAPAPRPVPIPAAPAPAETIAPVALPVEPEIPVIPSEQGEGPNG